MAQNFQRKPGRVAVWAGIWLYPYIRIYDSGESALSHYKIKWHNRSTLQYARHTLTATFVNAHAEDVLGTSRCWCVWWRHWFTIVEVTTGRVAPAPKAMFAVTSSFTTSMWPFRAATYTGVDPSACSFSAVMYTRVNPASAVACCFYQKFSTSTTTTCIPRTTPNKQTNKRQHDFKRFQNPKELDLELLFYILHKERLLLLHWEHGTSQARDRPSAADQMPLDGGDAPEIRNAMASSSPIYIYR